LVGRRPPQTNKCAITLDPKKQICKECAHFVVKAAGGWRSANQANHMVGKQMTTNTLSVYLKNFPFQSIKMYFLFLLFVLLESIYMFPF